MSIRTTPGSLVAKRNASSGFVSEDRELSWRDRRRRKKENGNKVERAQGSMGAGEQGSEGERREKAASR
eukprot:1326747-Rhodomonas_salina.4